MSRRALAVWAAIVLLLIVVIVLMPRAESGSSTRAFRRFLAASGIVVSGGGSPPDTGGVFVLLHDLRSREEAEALLAWASDGGRLVVADPASEVVSLTGAAVGEPLGLVGAQRIEPDCVAEEAVGVGRVVARASDRALRADGFVSCYRGLVLSRRHGDGTVVLMGGSTALTNEHLRVADNAVLAQRLAGGRSRVVIGSPTAVTAGGPSPSLWAALPGRAKAVILAAAAGRGAAHPDPRGRAGARDRSAPSSRSRSRARRRVDAPRDAGEARPAARRGRRSGGAATGRLACDGFGGRARRADPRPVRPGLRRGTGPTR